jgi:hypothetical protein
VNCRVLPDSVDGFAGVTSMEVNVAAVTVRVVLELIVLVGSVAVIVTDPGATAFANPLVALSLLIVAIVVSLELQVTEAVISCVVLSE